MTLPLTLRTSSLLPLIDEAFTGKSSIGILAKNYVIL